MEKELFQLALNIQDPWFIDRIEFVPDEKRLDLWIDFIPGSEFECPEYGRTECKAYDTSDKTWRHLNFFQYKCYLHCRVPRVECKKCGIHQVKVPWARKKSGFTFLMDSMIVLMAQKCKFHTLQTSWKNMIHEFNIMMKKQENGKISQMFQQ